jgi:hypothetical protein
MSILNRICCCDVMTSILERGSSALVYYPDIRSYQIREIIFHKKNISVGASNEIRYCPWCSSKLPKPLGNEWEKFLRKELKIKRSLKPEETNLIPDEFKTDEWWKKRGL